MFDFLLLLAKNSAKNVPAAAEGGDTNSLSWAIVLFSLVLGLLVTLRPSGRSSEIKRVKVE